jgi:ribosomal protein L31E
VFKICKKQAKKVAKQLANNIQKHLQKEIIIVSRESYKTTWEKNS